MPLCRVRASRSRSSTYHRADCCRPASFLEARIRVVLNADDFGLAPGIDAAILTLLQRGRLSGVSAMTTAPFWEADGPRLAPFTAAADIGLHFALTDVPTIGAAGQREDGTPFTYAQWQARAWTGRIEIDMVLDELRRQWQRFGDVVGRAPSHLDSHQHLHQQPGVRRAVLAFVDGLPAGDRPYVRTCVERPRTILRRNVNNLRALSFAWAGARLARGLRARGVATNDGFSGVYDFAAADYRALFRRFLRDVRDRAIVVCHPAQGEAPGDPIAAARSREYAYLAGDKMPADLAEAGVRVGRFAG
jgi:predicted glycoside hydrolase/deacetylase ChbG (UPF0249 family)